jgi:hypothetical protein
MVAPYSRTPSKSGHHDPKQKVFQFVFVITMPSWAFSVHGRNKDGKVMRR